MFKLLAFLIILVILFGVEATRALIFGAFGVIFWVVLIIFAILLFAPSPTEKFEREKRQKEYEKELEARRQRNEAISNARRQASIAKQKAWRKKHKKASKLLDLMADHPTMAAIILAIVSIFVICLVVGLVSNIQK